MPRTLPVGLPGVLSHNSFGVVAAVGGPERGERVDGHRGRPGQPRADVVGRVGDPRERHDVTRARAP